MQQPSKETPGKVQITRRENVEFGLVAILVSLFLALRASGGFSASGGFRASAAHYAGAGQTHASPYILAAFGLTLLTIVVPRIFYPFAVVWFGLSRVLGRVSSAVLMTLVFGIIVVPAGLVRKWRGIDPMRIKEFKKGEGSVLIPRNHVYVKEDLSKTF